MKKQIEEEDGKGRFVGGLKEPIKTVDGRRGAKRKIEKEAKEKEKRKEEKVGK